MVAGPRRWIAVISLGALLPCLARAGSAPVAGADERLSAGVPPGVRSRLEEAERTATLRRGFETVRFDSREPLFVYFLDHADVAAAAGKALGASSYMVERRPDGSYRCDDTRGASGTVEVLYADARYRLFSGAGTYSSRWLAILRVRGLLALEFEHVVGADGRAKAVVGATAFVRLENPFLDVLVRISRPLLAKIVDRKVARALRAAGKVSGMAYDDPAGFLDKLRRSGKLSAEAVSELAKRLPAG